MTEPIGRQQAEQILRALCDCACGIASDRLTDPVLRLGQISDALIAQARAVNAAVSGLTTHPAHGEHAPARAVGGMGWSPGSCSCTDGIFLGAHVQARYARRCGA